MFEENRNVDNGMISIKNNNLYKDIISIGINNCESILLSVNSKKIEYLVMDRLKSDNLIYLLAIDFCSTDNDELILIEIDDIEVKIFSDNENISKFFQLKENSDENFEVIGKIELKSKIHIINLKDFEDTSKLNNSVRTIIEAIKELNIKEPELN